MKGTTKNIFQSVLVLGLLLAGNVVMWGSSSYQAILTVQPNETGLGTVYVYSEEGDDTSFDDKLPTDTGYSSKSGATITFHIKAIDPKSNYHFSSWSGSDGVNFTNASSSETTCTAAAATSKGDTKANKYTATATFVKDIYYATLSATPTPSAGGSASVTKSPLSTETKGSNVTFNISATPNSGYHFVNWTPAGAGTFGDASSTTTTFTAPASSSYDEANAVNYTVSATFAENYYVQVLTSSNDNDWGKAYVKYGSTFGGSETSATNDDGNAAANQDETFSIKAVPNAKYHFVNWTSSDVTTLPTTEGGIVKVKTKSDKQGKSNQATYNVKANFAENYFTKVTVDKNTDGGTAYVKFGNSFSGTNTEDTNGNGNAATGQNEIYSLKATEKPGFAFTGWEAANGTLANPNNPSTTVTVTTNASYHGEGNPFTCNVTANFKEIYCITIKAGTETGKGRIVFKVTGPKNYRVSVPVGGQIVLKDVPEGDYTITPQTAWSWSYDVTPAEQHTSFSPTDNMSTNVFTVAPKSTTKKHAEVGKTVTTPGE